MKKVFLFTFVLLALVGCSLDEDDYSNVSYDVVPVSSYEFPESFTKGESYKIPFRFILPNSCYDYIGYDYQPVDSTRYVTPLVRIYEDQACTEQTIEVTDTLRMDIIYDHTYVFKLYNGRDSNGQTQYITQEVPVVD